MSLRDEKFWSTLQDLTSHLATWHSEGHEVPEDVCQQCQKVCLLLKEHYAQAICADPRNIGRVRAIRDAYADTWSVINSRLEFKLAETHFDEIQDYSDFLNFLETQPVVMDANTLPQTEIQLLEEKGLNLTGLKVAMIGPGAVPYTALAYAQAGAHITAIDCYAPACAWLDKWFKKLLQPNQYTLVQGWAEQQDYSGYDVVIVASMLLNRKQVIRAVENTHPGFVFIRTTSNRRPMSVLLPQPQEGDMEELHLAEFIGETNPPLRIGNFSLLYQYPQT